MKAKFHGLSSQGELGSKTYTVQYLRTRRVNGVYTPNGETDMANTPQRTKNKISEKADIRAHRTHAFSCQIKLLFFELCKNL